jgi:dTDP-glucose 4,6-dehydratase
VDAFIRAADSSRGIGEVINIGTGKEIAVSGLVREVEQILGKRLKVIHDKERVRPKKSEVERLCADAGKAKRLLGWSPKVGLREGLKETVEYIRLNISRYKSQDYIV